MQPDPTATAHPSTGDARDEGVRGVSMRAGTSRGYAVGYLRDVELGADVAEYLQRIEATLALFGGEWVIHGATPQPKEGAWPGDLVVIAFPTLALAEAWYASPEYQAILGLRRAHANSMVALVEGVPSGYQAVSTLQRLMTSPPPRSSRRVEAQSSLR